MKLLVNKEGKKMYPVCSWEANQHKLYNAIDRIQLALYDATDEEYDKLAEALERVEHALDVFNRTVVQGIVYATYEDSLIIKDIIWAYNARK